MLDYILSRFSLDLGIDLGTSNTLVLALGKGIVIREPTVCAVLKKTKDILAVGEDAKKMQGKTPSTISVIRPLRSGVVSDFDIAEKMLSFYIKKAHASFGGLKIPKPRVVLGVPSGVTEVQGRAVFEASRNAGARASFLVEEPIASALGAGLPVEDPTGSLIVDIGGGTTEIAVISLGGIVVSKSIKVAGDEMDQAIINYAKKCYDMLLGEKTAEEVKIQVGNVLPNSSFSDLKTTLRGRDLKSGLPKSVEIRGDELREAIKYPVSSIISSIKDLIEETPPELISDIIRNGITLSGGGSLLRGIDKLIAEEIRIKVKIAKDPLTCVVRGCAILLKKPDLLKRVELWQ